MTESGHNTIDETSHLYEQLSYFLTSDQTERVIETTRALLVHDPQSAWLHNTLTDALIESKDYQLAEIHSNKSLALDPDEGNIYSTRARLELARGRTGKAEDYISKAIRLEPENTWNWYIGGVLAVQFDNYDHAMFCVNKIRELSPNSSLADELAASARKDIEGKYQVPKEQQLSDQFNLLKKSPESDTIKSTIATIYADEFKDYDAAEDYARQALTLDPNDKDHKKLLILILRKKDWVLGLLWLPYLPVTLSIDLSNWAWQKKWPLIFMIFLFKYLIVFTVGCALLFFIFFWPLAKVYEYLTLADTHKKMGLLSLYSSPMKKLHKLPFYIRFSIFIVIVILFWSLVILFFRDDILADKGTKLFAYSVAAFSIAFVIYSWFTYFRQGARRRKQNKPQS